MKHVSASQFECKNNENLSLIYSRTPHQDNCSDDIINDEYMYAYTVCSCYMYVCSKYVSKSFSVTLAVYRNSFVFIRKMKTIYKNT